jgi:hypothetical protein
MSAVQNFANYRLRRKPDLILTSISGPQPRVNKTSDIIGHTTRQDLAAHCSGRYSSGLEVVRVVATLHLPPTRRAAFSP